MYQMSEEHTLLRDTARGFLHNRAPVTALRALRDGGERLAYSRDLHRELAEMGFFGVLLPEALGGTGFGARAAGIIAEEMGRNLTASPFLSTAVLAATTLKEAGGEALAVWGPRIASGEALIALALDERTKHDPARITTTAIPEGNGYVLSGRKIAVSDAIGADRLIVAADTGGKTALFLIDPAAEGTAVAPRRLLDSRNAGDVDLEGARVDGPLGTIEGGAEILARTLRTGRAVAAAEQLGGARGAAVRTLAYLGERRQFGVLIGQFQALQHRAADLYCRLEECGSLIAAALDAIDRDAPEAEALSRAAKAKAALVGRQASEEAVQMHGGIGMTDELDIGLFMKRDRAQTEALGDAAHHIDCLLRQRGL
jgi:alkylation response protein AidB-like acyl-CoA dehydrogenase